MPKYHQTFISKHGIEYTVTSSDDYVFRSDDFYQVIKIFSSPDTYKFISKNVLKQYYPETPFVEITAMDFVKHNANYWKKGGQYRFFVRRKSDDILVGYVNFEPRKDDLPERSLAKLDTEPSFMKVALLLCLNYFKDMGYPKTFGDVDPENQKMLSLANSLGMQLVGESVKDNKKSLRFELTV